MGARKEGAFIEIALPDGKFGYGRILPKASFAFYAIYSATQLTDIQAIGKHKVLFINSVYKHAISKDRWKIIGMAPLEPALTHLPMEFLEDQLAPGHFELYNPNTGDMTPTKKENCVGLEYAAVWEPQHIEDRLVDHFAGRPNQWAESLKLK